MNHNRALEVLQTSAVARLRRYLTDHETDDLREVARAFVDARAHFFTQEGTPDWRGRTHAYRTFVRESMTLGGVPGDELTTVQAAIRYHVGNALRETLDETALADLGLVKSSPRERSVEKRGRTSGVLQIFTGGAVIAELAEIREAVRLIEHALRRMELDGLTRKERAEAKSLLADMCKRASILAEVAQK